MVNLFPKPFIVLAFFALLTACATAQQKDPCALPTSLQNELATKYPGQRPVRISDLSTYNKRFYRKDHGNHCPGLVKVDLYGDKKPTWTIILRKNDQGISVTELLVAQQIEDGWKLNLLKR
jgi:hypothetical protein